MVFRQKDNLQLAKVFNSSMPVQYIRFTNGKCICRMSEQQLDATKSVLLYEMFV